MERTKHCCLHLWSVMALVAILAVAVQASARDTYLPWEGGSAYYAQFSLGPSSSQDYFTPAVWLQSPRNAGLFGVVGVNQFVGLWGGTVEVSPKEGPILPLLRQYYMRVFGDWETALAGPDASKHLTDSIIDGWAQEDKPDNAQSLPTGGYGDCIPPSAIVSIYKASKKADPNRPVYLGSGTAAGGPRQWFGITCAGKQPAGSVRQ